MLERQPVWWAREIKHLAPRLDKSDGKWYLMLGTSVLLGEVPLAIARWRPRGPATRQEAVLLKRGARTRKLFGFLRLYRGQIFDDSFQAELEGMYRDTGAGLPAIPPALMAMATLLQGYLGVSDAEAVELSVVDLRWQMVLDRLGADEPAFSQGALFEFRERLIRTDMDRRLLERTA